MKLKCGEQGEMITERLLWSIICDGSQIAQLEIYAADTKQENKRALHSNFLTTLTSPYLYLECCKALQGYNKS
jgi:uncharacterized protein YcgI (DUF1989 family)